MSRKIILSLLLLAGCGSGSSFQSGSGLSPVPNSVPSSPGSLKIAFDPSSLPAGVQRVQLLGFSGDQTMVLPPVTVGVRGTQLQFDPVGQPDLLKLRTLVVEYLSGDSLTGLSVVELGPPSSDGWLISAPASQPVADQLTSLRLERGNLTIAAGGLTRLRALGVLRSGLEIDLTPYVSWTFEDAGRAKIQEGLLRALAPGTTSLSAQLAGRSARCSLTVANAGNPPDLVIPSGFHTLDTNTGTLDGQPFAGYDPDNMSFLVRDFLVARGANLRFSGDPRFVLGAQGKIDLQGSIVGEKIDPATSMVLAQKSVDLSCAADFSADINGEIVVIANTYNGDGGSINLFSDGQVTAGGAMGCAGSHVDGRGGWGNGGNINITSGSKMTVYRLDVTSGNFANSGGNIRLVSGGTFEVTSNLKADGGNGSVDVGSFSVAGGSIDVKADSTIKMLFSGVTISSNAGNSADFGGPGGRVQLTSTNDSVVGVGNIHCRGGNAQPDDFFIGTGGHGGEIQITSATSSSFHTLDVSGGAGLPAPQRSAGGAGGTIRANQALNVVQLIVSGGVGTPNGPPGSVVIGP